MKRLTFCLALLALLIAGTVGAYRIIEVPEVGARTVTMVMGGVAAEGCSNDPATDEIGYTTAGATSEYASGGTMHLWRFQATNLTCDTGTLERAYLWDRTNYDSLRAKVCIYTSSDTTPQSGDALVGCSDEIVGTTANTWYYASASGTYEVTKNDYYWVAIWANNDWDYRSDGSGVTCYYKSVSGYPSAPATIGTGWNTTTGRGQPSVYFRVQ